MDKSCDTCPVSTRGLVTGRQQGCAEEGPCGVGGWGLVQGRRKGFLSLKLENIGNTTRKGAATYRRFDKACSETGVQGHRRVRHPGAQEDAPPAWFFCSRVTLQVPVVLSWALGSQGTLEISFQRKGN